MAARRQVRGQTVNPRCWQADWQSAAGWQPAPQKLTHRGVQCGGTETNLDNSTAVGALRRKFRYGRIVPAGDITVKFCMGIRVFYVGTGTITL
jgi:hypothetical protein